jgi:hypothetical protein
MLKSRGIKDLGTQSETQLEQTFKGTKEQPGVGVELAKLYEQMATLMPTPGYATMGAQGFAQVLTSGTINRQLAIFEGNPVLVEALKTIDGGIAATSDVGKRVQILKKALEVAAPTMMLDEMRMSVAGGMQAISDTLTNPSVGILSMAMEVQDQGAQTLADFGKVQGKVVKGSAYALKLEDFDRKQKERREEMLKKGGDLDKIEIQQQKQRKEFIDKLDDILQNANSPLERIAVSLSPVLQSISGVLNAMGSVFMGPVNAAMKTLDTVFAQLQINLDNIASNLRAKKYTSAEGLGRLFAEILKAISTLFDPSKAGAEAGTAIDKMFADFMKGFNSEKVNGSKYLDMVMKGLQDIIMRLLFKEGDITKGTTPLADGLGKIFLLLSAPAFVNALIMGLVPIAIQGMGGMMLKVFTGIGPKIVAANAAKNAAAAATAAKAANAAKTATIASAKLGAAPVAATAGATGAASGLSAVPVLGWIAALTAAFVIFEKPIMEFSKALRTMGQKMQTSKDWMTSSMGHVLDGIMQLIQGVTKFFNGLWEIVSGLLMGDTDRVVNGIKKLFSGVADAFVGIGRTIGGLGGVVTTAIGNVFKAVAGVLDRAANFLAKAAFGDRPDNKRLNPFTGELKLVTPDPKGGGRAGYETRNGVKGWRSTSGEWTALAKGSGSPFTGNLRQAIDYEMANKPRGSSLVVANSSETIIPAAAKGSYKPFMNSPGPSLNYEVKQPFMESLGPAINYEMKNKPSGSSLVVANSSETIIPAAGGLNGGMAGVIDAVWRSSQGIMQTFLRGFDTLIKTTAAGDATVARTTQQTGAATRASIERSTAIQMAGDAKIMSAIRAASAAGGIMGDQGFGGGLGGGKGGLGAASSLAKSMGLTMTSFKRSGPANASYHNVGRAMDFSNSTGPTPQMMKFAQTLAATSGSNLAELIYTPLGYSIKHGKKIPPIAQSSHYNHVHVAYAYGPGSPAFFSNQNEAMAWERQMMPGGARVRSVTSNSSESLGGTSVGNINVTINAGHTNDPDQLATIVAQRLSQAIQEVRSASIFV